jgi:UDP-3-O-[3-hydroxymyristoyl] glucosamine N-acyltransferase
MKFPKNQSINEIATLLNGEVFGDINKEISAIDRIEDAGEFDLTFIADIKYEKYAEVSKAAAIIVDKEFPIEKYENNNFIVVESARKSFNHILNFLDSQRKIKKSGKIHKSASIGENVSIDPSAFIGANVVIGDNCTIESDAQIMPGVVLYDHVTVKKGTIINSNVVCYDEVEIGEKCIIHAGAIIGADGFGFEEQKDGSYIKVPQLGSVKIGNNVEIGANTTIDRALLGSTIIEDGVKLDNLVQIAHNVVVGENSAMASQVGVSGSAHIGKRNRFGGQVGVAGHLTTCDDVIIYAKSGVSKSVENKGVYFGAPIKDRLKAFKIEAVINNLPDLKKEVSDLRRKIESLESK